MGQDSSNICYYFVDEAGDTTLFDRKGRVIVGTEGCSRYFILGLLHVPNPRLLTETMENLRASLLNDPYFKRVPSMQPSARKTAVSFHAKDDISEVRWQVLRILASQSDIKFFAVVRDKLRVLAEVRQYGEKKKYTPNTLYDQLVSRIFRDRLHKQEEYNIIFASRGSGDRTQALRNGIEVARRRFERRWSKSSSAPIVIQAMPAEQSGCLQAVDYFLWALQRCYEKREDRYIEYLWGQCRLIQDIDDTRLKNYGVYYDEKNVLLASKLPEV
jgi:hypothetical protein